MKIDIVFFAPFPPPNGGVRVAAAALADELESRSDFLVHRVELDLGPDRSAWWFPKNVAQIVRQTRRSSAQTIWILNADFRTTVFLSLPFLIVAKVVGSRTVLRKFAGNLDLRLASMPAPTERLVLRFIREFDLVFLETERLIDSMSSQLPNLAQFRNGRDPAAYTVHSGDSHHGPHRFLYLGLISESKGLRLLAQSWPAVLAEHANSTLTICGAFEDEASGLREQLSSLDRVEIIEPVAPETVPTILGRHDTLVFPSSRSAEGHPGVLVEALMSGTPSICFDAGSSSEVIKDGGGVIAESTVAGLASVMCTLASDMSLHERLRGEALAARTKWSVSTGVDQLTFLIGKLT